MYKAVLTNNPAKTVKLTPTSSNPHLSVKILVGRYAAIRRRCAQTARISLHEPISLKERPPDKKQTIRQMLGVFVRALSSGFSKLSLGRSRRFVSIPSHLCFGGAVFTKAARNPQEGKVRSCDFFCWKRKILQNLGVGARLRTRAPI